MFLTTACLGCNSNDSAAQFSNSVSQLRTAEEGSAEELSSSKSSRLQKSDLKVKKNKFSKKSSPTILTKKSTTSVISKSSSSQPTFSAQHSTYCSSREAIYRGSSGEEIKFEYSCGGGACQVEYSANGDCLVDNSAGDFVLQSSLPAAQNCPGRECKNGLEINPSHNDRWGLDGRYESLWDEAEYASLPARLDSEKTHSIVKAVSRESCNSGSRRQCLDFVAVLSVLPQMPNNPKDTFRPSYFGAEKTPHTYRVSDIRLELLSKLSKSLFSDGPSDTSILNFLKHAGYGNHIAGQHVRRARPWTNFYCESWGRGVDYWAEVASCLETAMLRTNMEDFAPLTNPVHGGILINLLQRGIDQHNLIRLGHKLMGHGMPTKTRLWFSAILFGESILIDTVSNEPADGQYQLTYAHSCSTAPGREQEGIFGWQTSYQCSSDNYWTNYKSFMECFVGEDQDVGSCMAHSKRKCKDPHGQIDAAGGGWLVSAYGYQNAGYQARIRAARLLTGLFGDRQVWNHECSLNYSDRWDLSEGTSGHKKLFGSEADSCAGWTKDGELGVDYGLKPDNPTDCNLTGTCECIEATSTDETRFSHTKIRENLQDGSEVYNNTWVREGMTSLRSCLDSCSCPGQACGAVVTSD